MTEILQALMHFFEKIGEKTHAPVDEHVLITELQELGMPPEEVQRIIHLINQYYAKPKEPIVSDYPVQTHMGTRIFSPVECQHLNKKSRSLLLQLEQEGILTPTARELVIDQLLQLHPEEINKARISWTVFRILTQMQDKSAIACMERFMLREMENALH